LKIQLNFQVINIVYIITRKIREVLYQCKSFNDMPIMLSAFIVSSIFLAEWTTKLISVSESPVFFYNTASQIMVS